MLVGSHDRANRPRHLVEHVAIGDNSWSRSWLRSWCSPCSCRSSRFSCRRHGLEARQISGTGRHQHG